jgi:hypothetical protein
MTTDDLLNEKREEIREKLGADSKQHPLNGPPNEATRFPASLLPCSHTIQPPHGRKLRHPRPV